MMPPPRGDGRDGARKAPSAAPAGRRAYKHPCDKRVLSSVAHAPVERTSASYGHARRHTPCGCEGLRWASGAQDGDPALYHPIYSDAEVTAAAGN
jgi:hypothetical protein